MKRDAVVVAVLAGVVASTSVRADEPSNCDECKDLCRLMFAYSETDALVEMYRQYAHSNENRQELAWDDNPVKMVEKQFNEEWSPKRQLPCGKKDAKDDGKAVTKMYVDIENKDCPILNADGTPLTPESEQQFHRATNCKPESDAIIEHEKLHQQHCKNAYADKDAALGFRIIGTPAITAESELLAHIKQRDMLANQIRKIVSEKNCGWTPTQGQQHSGAMPSLGQIKKMEERGWAAVMTLGVGH